jgi:hypothetical protein
LTVKTSNNMNLTPRKSLSTTTLTLVHIQMTNLTAKSSHWSLGMKKIQRNEAAHFTNNNIV